MAGDDDVVIDLCGLDKSYSLESRPWRRLWQQLAGGEDHGPQHHALHGVDLRVRRGEAIGVIGRNGAGKSTLLQVICGVLQPSRGTRRVKGRIAALLELGAGFNPELTGRENVRLNGPLLGISAADIERRLPGIVDFAGIGEYIDQPVRSYSSGMFVRLAFSMATSVEPDILVIDEALSVGDGEFARKSFERIMALKERGATLLFCSHSMFQVESLCPRAIWLEDGRVRFDGPASQAVVAYDAFLAAARGAGAADGGSIAADGTAGGGPDGGDEALVRRPPLASAAATIDCFERLSPTDDGAPLHSRRDALTVRVAFRSDPTIPCPTLGITLHGPDGRTLSSAGTWLDGITLPRDAAGRVEATLCIPALPLLKGRYTLSAYVLCDRAINLYAAAEHAITLDVVQHDVQQGVVALPHHWQVGSPE
ncbi:ABC transporter ATP-binding protein [Ideonella sp. A 288]|uniref:ABC transporter ATP-binding protein n=1 Tax=Ideonella sp. A 288 TaxID=1962181 RepID=UPI000B4B5EBC|nr:ABC transporter ATP-binding protein [Ideonella sp. A 288]